MADFATNLRKRAEQLGFSNAEVARRAGLSERRYGNYVSGAREPDLNTLVRIAQTLGTSIDSLLGLDDVSLNKTSEEVFQERIQAALRALREEQLASLVVMIEALATDRTRQSS
ncbi:MULTISPECIES: helix-turn-helix domain-containing protein [unclassified Rhizobium]|uniref:helix-turn-helix domain-containing protein n=1 Tax=unclassified Rhizobium TaxID=2613769 RepID=UPI000DD6E5E6|nr:helix-turn-helix transcriptional regulator [Rhizobium sp. AN80A]